MSGTNDVKEMKSFPIVDWNKGQQHRWRLPLIVGLLVLVVGGSVWLNTSPFRSGFEITDELGGNIFPSSILSVATTDAQVIVPSDSLYVGNPKSCISIRVRSGKAYSRVRIEVAETPFFSLSVSEFVLAKPHTEYTIYSPHLTSVSRTFLQYTFWSVLFSGRKICLSYPHTPQAPPSGKSPSCPISLPPAAYCG